MPFFEKYAAACSGNFLQENFADLIAGALLCALPTSVFIAIGAGVIIFIYAHIKQPEEEG